MAEPRPATVDPEEVMHNDHPEARGAGAVFRRCALAMAALATACLGLVGMGSEVEAANSQRAQGTKNQSIFDEGVVHRISVRFDEAAYDKMIETFTATGDKDWIEATVKVDGKTFKEAGLRLKGNSSLAGLRGARAGAGQGAPQFPGGGGGPGGDASAETPEELPWLIRLDKFVDDQNYHGISELVVRSNNTETSLNEAVALEMLSSAGMATQQAAYARFVVNSSDPILRLIVENPSDTWDETNFTSDGVLYKAESGGDWSYRGTDPADYDEVFDQETDTDDEDLTPLIEFLDFINNTDDATFAAELRDRLDVEGFAKYLAFQDLIANSDDIDGPGNNAYLRYDPANDQFTVLAWDHNLAFGSLGGGFGGPGGAINGDAAIPPGDRPALPQGGGEGAAPGRGFPGRTNILVQRFKANAEFAALYNSALDTLRSELYASGTATNILETQVDLLRTAATDLVDEATITSEAAAVSRYFTNS